MLEIHVYDTWDGTTIGGNFKARFVFKDTKELRQKWHGLLDMYEGFGYQAFIGGQEQATGILDNCGIEELIREAERGNKVKRLTIAELAEAMEHMEIGETINIAGGFQNGTYGDWYGLRRLNDDMWKSENKIWVLCYYGGGESIHVITDFDDGFYLEDDLVKVLSQECLLQEEQTVVAEIKEV